MFYRYFLGLLAVLTTMFVLLSLVVFRIPENRVLLPLFLAVAFGMILIAGLFAFLVTRSAERRIQSFAAALQQLGRHDFVTPLPTAKADEFATLDSAMKECREKLIGYTANLVREHEQLNAILFGMVEGVVALDNSQRVLFANDRACALLEVEEQQIRGKKIGEVSREPAIQSIVEKAMFQSGTCREELDWRGKESRNLAVYVSRLAAAEALGAVVVLHDITELRRLERLRQDFVANVSHELKTPLAVIRSNVEALVDGAAEDPTSRMAFLGRIQHETLRLADLIQDILKLASIESGQKSNNFTPALIGQGISDCLERLATRAEEKTMSIIEVPPKNAPRDLRVWADVDQLSHILDNLVGNAMKYTHNGGKITIRWKAEPDTVSIEIEDNGVGISKDDLPRIFERFYRADKARNRNDGGTGLGLAIVKHLVQNLNGQISVTSELDVGTCFRVTLPRYELER